MILVGPILILSRFHRERRVARSAMFAGAVAALGLAYLTEPTQHRWGWALRANAYVEDILDVPEQSVRCRFVDDTRIALACEVNLHASQLEQLANLVRSENLRTQPCGQSKIDPCGRIPGLCSGPGQLSAGVDVYDAEDSENRAAIELRKNKVPYSLMLENLYIDRLHSRACLVINTGGRDQLSC